MQGCVFYGERRKQLLKRGSSGLLLLGLLTNPSPTLLLKGNLAMGRVDLSYSRGDQFSHGLDILYSSSETEFTWVK